MLPFSLYTMTQMPSWELRGDYFDSLKNCCQIVSRRDSRSDFVPFFPIPGSSMSDGESPEIFFFFSNQQRAAKNLPPDFAYLYLPFQGALRFLRLHWMSEELRAVEGRKCFVRFLDDFLVFTTFVSLGRKYSDSRGQKFREDNTMKL